MEPSTPTILQIGTRKDTGGGAGILHALTDLVEVKENLFLNMNLRDLLILRRYLKSHDINIIQSHGTRAATIVRLVLATMRTKPMHVYTVHGFHISHRTGIKRRMLLNIERFLNQWTDQIVSVSKADKTHIIRTTKVPPQQITVIPNGIDVERFAHAQATKRESLAMKESDVVLLHVSRLHHQKDLKTVINAMSHLPTNYHLLIVGNGELKETLEQQTKSLKLTQRIHFLDARKDVPNLMRMADTLILSSHWEGCPLVILEAMASKLPVIASNVDGNNELITDTETGRLFKHKDSEALSKTIIEVMENNTTQGQIENAFNIVSKHHTKELMKKHYLALWNKLV